MMSRVNWNELSRLEKNEVSKTIHVVRHMPDEEWYHVYIRDIPGAIMNAEERMKSANNSKRNARKFVPKNKK